MKRLYARMPDGMERDFGEEEAALAESLPPVERDILVSGLVMTERIKEVGVSNVGEFQLHYEIRDVPSALLVTTQNG